MSATAERTRRPRIDPLLEPLRIATAKDRGRCVVTVDGELDICHVPELELALELAGREQGAGVLLDLERLTFIDGRAIRALAKATRRFARSKTAFSIAHASGQVSRIMSVSGAEAVLPMRDRRRERSLPRPFGVDFLSGART